MESTPHGFMDSIYTIIGFDTPLEENYRVPNLSILLIKNLKFARYITRNYTISSVKNRKHVIFSIPFDTTNFSIPLDTTNFII